jgi:hypothetical protein
MSALKMIHLLETGHWCRMAPVTRLLFELDPSLPRLYVMPILSILGTVLLLVRAGNTGTIPHYMRGRGDACFPGGKTDSATSKGDGSRLYFVNSWAMKLSQNPSRPQVCQAACPAITGDVIIQRVRLRRKRGPVTLTRMAWVQFLPSPTHETCLSSCCFAMSDLMKLAGAR